MPRPTTIREYRRTLDAKPNDSSIVKPGELVDVVELVPLTLNDRRIYNLLLANAWDKIDQPMVHFIPKRDLIGTLSKSTDRVGDSIKHLMAAMVEVKVMREGKLYLDRAQLLAPTSEPIESDGLVRYSFSEEMRSIISQSTFFARLQRKIIFALTSKYSLTLYEMIQKRGNLNKTSETFPVDQLRNYLGVPAGKLASWINFRNKALDPAIKEVSALSDYLITYKTVTSTKKGEAKLIAAVVLSWSRKEADALEDVKRELDSSKVGRKARIHGTVETVSFGTDDSKPRAYHVPIRPDTIEKAKKLMQGYDIYRVEADWRDWMKDKPAPDKPDGAFYSFCKTYKQNNPL